MPKAAMAPRRAAHLLALPLLLLAAPASAWPVDRIVDVEPGGAHIVSKLTALDWAVTEDPSIATAEVLPSRELLVNGVSRGRTLVLLYAEGRFAVWRVRVGERSAASGNAEAEMAAVKKACPGAKAQGGTFVATVKDERCRQALKVFFEGDGYVGPVTELTFEVEALQHQLSELQKNLKAKGLPSVKVSYVGAGLVLEGTVSPPEHTLLLWTLFKTAVGRTPVQDKLELQPDPKSPETPTP